MTRPTTRRGPGRPPGSDGAETRLRILQSARQVFSTTGFDRASLKQIAETAGLTRNAIANYYSSKLELYNAALQSVHSVVVDRILDDAKAITGPVHVRILGVFESATDFSQTDESFVRFFVTSTADAIHHPDLRDQALQPIVAVQAFVQNILEDAKRLGEVDEAMDTGATTQVLMDLLWGLAMDIGFHSDETWARRTMQALRRLIGAALAPAEVRAASGG